MHVVAADVGADRAELPGLVVIEIGERFGHVHHVRPRVGGLLDDVEHRQRMVRVASDGVELVRRRHHTAPLVFPITGLIDAVVNTTLYENGNVILMPVRSLSGTCLPSCRSAATVRRRRLAGVAA